MLNKGKYEVLGVKVSACDYDYIIQKIEESVKKKRGLLIFPTASHSLTNSLFNKEQKEALGKFDYVVPDSQWVRRSLAFLYGVKLPDRVYGPELTLKVCGVAQEKGFRTYFLSRDEKTLLKLTKKIKKGFPKLKIALDPDNSDIAFIGLGSPFQERYTAQNFKSKKIVAIPVGAAFDFISGAKPQAPAIMQKAGFEWLFRLIKEPRRLWSRYLILAPLFVFLVLFQKLKLWLKSGSNK